MFQEILIDKSKDSSWHSYENGTTIDLHYTIINSNLSPITKKVILPENGIYIIDNGFVQINSGLNFSNEFDLYSQLSWFYTYSNINQDTNKDWIYQYLKTQFDNINNQIIKIDGVCLNLLSFFTDTNFSHFIIDHCTKLDIISNLNLDSFDYILLPTNNFNFKQLIYDYFNIPKHNIITTNQYPKYSLLKFKKVYAVSNRGLMRYSRPGSFTNIVDAITHKYKSSNINNKKIFLSRSGRKRHIMDIENLFESIGYTIIHDCSNHLNDIINAEIIIGQHGANLTNIILTNQNCKIIEIFNDDHIYEYYMSLSHAIDNKYYTGIIYTDKDNLISNIRKITNE